MNAFDEEWWTLLALPVAGLVAVAIGRWLGPDRRRAFYESDAGSRVIGVLLIIVAVAFYRTLAYLPITKALQAGRKTVLANLGSVALSAIFAQIGLLFLVLGRRKHRWFPANQTRDFTREQHTVAISIVSLGLLAMFAFMKYYGLRSGR